MLAWVSRISRWKIDDQAVIQFISGSMGWDGMECETARLVRCGEDGWKGGGQDRRGACFMNDYEACGEYEDEEERVMR